MGGAYKRLNIVCTVYCVKRKLKCEQSEEKERLEVRILLSSIIYIFHTLLQSKVQFLAVEVVFEKINCMNFHKIH